MSIETMPRNGSDTTSMQESKTLREAVRDFEQSYILESLKLNGFDKRKSARALGISLSSFYRKIVEHEIHQEETSEASAMNN